MTRSSYSVWGVSGGVVYIIDEHNENNPTMSITNDAEAVVAEVAAKYPLTPRIVYRDTVGDWDELKHDRGKFIGFASWHGFTPR